MKHSISPVGYISSPFKEKFAVPRQAKLAASVRATIKLVGGTNNIDTVRELEQFSHLWLLFLFDQNLAQGWTPTVRPPRLGGNKKVGVFASRATFRPNGIGMSAVKLVDVRHENGQVLIDIGCCDLMDGTPVIDIKPYIPYSDAIPEAIGGFAAGAPEILAVEFSNQAAQFLQQQKEAKYKKNVIAEVLAQDPRPAYKKGKTDKKEYAVLLFEFNVKFVVTDCKVMVTAIDSANPN